MRFKLLCGFLILSILTAGCSFIDDGERRQEEMRIDSAESACMSRWPETLTRYFAGGRDTEQENTEFRPAMEEFWLCSRNVLMTFKQQVRGERAGNYTAQEVLNVLRRFLANNDTFTLELVRDLLRLKQVLVGGSATDLSFTDIDRILDLLLPLKDMTIDLMPYIDIVLMREDLDISQHADREKFETAQMTMQVALERTGDVINRWPKQAYTRVEFQGLMEKLAQFFAEQGEKNPPQMVLRFLPLVFAAKKIFFGDYEDEISPHNWRDFFSIAGEGFGLVSGIYYLAQAEQGSRGEGLTYFFGLADNFFAVLQAVIGRHVDQVVPFILWQELFERLQEREIVIKDRFTAEVVSGAFEVFVRKMLRDPAQPSTAEIIGLTTQHAEVLRRHVARWFGAQTFFNQQVTESAVYAETGLQQLFTPPFTAWVGVLATRDFVRAEDSQRGLEDMRRLFARPRTILWHDADSIRVGPLAAEEGPQALSFFRTNWINLIIQLVMRGYAQDPVRALETLTLTKPELQLFYTDMYALGQQLTVADPRKPLDGERMFLEGDMFTYQSNGDGFVDSIETVEMISFLYSAGRTAKNRIYDDMAHNCPARGMGVFAYPGVELECFRQRLRGNFSRYFRGLPAVNAMLAAGGDAVWEEFNSLLESAALEHIEQGYVDKSDMEVTAAVLQYSEALFSRFDHDQSGLLAPQEIDGAYSVLRGFLASMSPSEDDLLVRGIFNYILQRQRPPAADLNGAFDLIGHMTSQGLRLEEPRDLNRVDMMRIFANIAAAFRGAAAPAAQ